jgi:hypothetical protein
MSVMVIVAQGEGPMGVPPVQNGVKVEHDRRGRLRKGDKTHKLANSQRFMTLLIFYYLLHRLTIR